ncbi:MAG: hypothetical protein J6C43_02190 [Oscillospiraceae bacterium]|nr:hypothetical protein [Oscillospiraceae bacterium]
MKYTLTDQEQTIVTLREEQKLSFRAIGERLELSANKTSYAYHRAARKLRINRFHELREEQNQVMVSLSLSVGEVVILRRILSLFQTWKIDDCRNNDPELQETRNDPEYLAAENLEKRLSDLERAARAD